MESTAAIPPRARCAQRRRRRTPPRPSRAPRTAPPPELGWLRLPPDRPRPAVRPNQEPQGALAWSDPSAIVRRFGGSDLHSRDAYRRRGGPGNPAIGSRVRGRRGRRAGSTMCLAARPSRVLLRGTGRRASATARRGALQSAVAAQKARLGQAVALAPTRGSNGATVAWRAVGRRTWLTPTRLERTRGGRFPRRGDFRARLHARSSALGIAASRTVVCSSVTSSGSWPCPRRIRADI